MKRKQKQDKKKALPPGLLNMLSPLPYGRRRETSVEKKPARVPLEMVRSQEVFKADPSRSCGECQACCTVLAVRNLGKPFYVRCEHQKGGRCDCYATRPEECVAYVCSYLSGGLPPEEGNRPDKLGVLFNVEIDESLAHVSLWWITVYETRENGAGNILGEHLNMRPEVADLLVGLCRRAPWIQGIRLIPWNRRVGVRFAIKPPYPDEGESSSRGGRLYAGPPDQRPPILMRLEAPQRTSTEPMVHEEAATKSCPSSERSSE